MTCTSTTSQPKIWLTGSTGFLGTTFQKLLPHFEWIPFKGDITRTNEVLASLREAQPKYILHLAALSHPTQCQENPELAKSVNVDGTKNIANAIREIWGKSVAINGTSDTHKTTRVPHLIFMSTAQVYKPVNESQGSSIAISEEFEVAPINTYAQTKLDAEQALMQASLPALTILRLFNHVHYTQPPLTFLSSLYHQVKNHTGSKSGSHKILVGNLNLVRDIGSIFDLVSAIEKLFLTLENSDSEYSGQKSNQTFLETFNLGSGVGKNLNDLANMLVKACAPDIPIQFIVDPARVRIGEPKSVICNSNKFQSFTGWKPKAQSTESLIHDFLKEI